MRPANKQISLRIDFRVVKNSRIVQADSEDPNQTAQKRSLIWVFADRKGRKVFFLRLKLIHVQGLELKVLLSIKTVLILFLLFMYLFIYLF